MKFSDWTCGTNTSIAGLVKLSLDYKKSEMKGVNDRVEEFIVKQLKCGSKAVSSYELALQTCQLVKVSNVPMNRARIFKLLRSPGINSTRCSRYRVDTTIFLIGS
jgi:hypothetical protein